jgi:hypothetical protein
MKGTNMIKNNIIFLFILMFSGVSFAELSCSANGTQIYYINGVHVEADNTADARNIDVLIRSSPYNPNEIDKSSNLPTVLGVYNYSTGFFDDFTKLRRQLLLDDGDMTSEKRRKHFDELIKKEFNFLVASVWSSRSTEYKEKAGASLKKTLDYIYNAGDKNSITNYDRAFTENKLYEELKLLDSQLADLVAIAAVDRQVVIKVKKVISDSVFTDNKKVIFVAHSQGNEALRTSYLELQNDLVGQKDKLDKLDKVFGTLHVASPSPVYIFPLPRSQGIKLDVDLVIKDSTLFTTDNTPLAINYYLETEGANASLFRRVPLIGNILGTIGEFITALLTFNPDAFLHHSFTATYLNDKIYARSVASDPSTSDSMPTIFHKNIVKVAEALGDNCDYPSLDFSVENTTKDPKGFTFTLPSYAPSILASVVVFNIKLSSL